MRNQGKVTTNFSKVTAVLKYGVSIGALLGCAVPAFADDTTSAAAAAANASGSDIVVTARRTEEKLRDVPVAVTAFSAKSLEERGITSETDLQTSTPGLLVRETTSSNQLNYAIRGQSVDAFSYSTPAVVAYFNEVQTFNNSSTAFFDLQGIQVLKGPQGTLFGRNATGGAVLYQAAKPTDDFGGYIKAGYGNYSDREVQGAINLPLGNGIDLRIAGSSQNRDGFQHNLLTGAYLNSIDANVGRVSLLIKPAGSGFENVTVVQYGDYGGNSAGLKLSNFYPVGTPGVATTMAGLYPANFVSTNPAVDALFAGTPYARGIAGFLQMQNATYGYYDVALNTNDQHQAYQTFVSNTTSYDLGGGAKLKNIFGYNREYSYDWTDLDGSPYSYFSIGFGTGNDTHYTNGTKQWSDELQVSGDAADGKLKYIAGAFISQERTYVRIPFAAAPEHFASPFEGVYAFTNVDKSEALYTQLSYKLLDNLNLTGGFRYTWEDISIIEGSDSLFAGIPSGDQKNAKPSWLIGLDYKVTPDLMIYFNQRGSWRAGGFNGTSQVGGAADPFLPETTYDFEVGAKYAGRIGDAPTTLNLAIYDQYVKNVQRVVYTISNGEGAALAGNVGEARVRGIEIDGSVRPTNWLELGGAFDYTDAVFTNPIGYAGGVPYTFGPYGDAPKYSGSIYARASTELPGDKGQLVLRGDFYTQSSFFYTNLANTIAPGTEIAGHSVINAKLEWNKMLGSKVDASLFVNNLTDKHYMAGGNALAGVQGSNATLPGAPRMYGFQLGIKF